MECGRVWRHQDKAGDPALPTAWVIGTKERQENHHEDIPRDRDAHPCAGSLPSTKSTGLERNSLDMLYFKH